VARAVRTYLEMTDPSALDGAEAPGPGISARPVEDAPPACGAFSTRRSAATTTGWTG